MSDIQQYYLLSGAGFLLLFLVRNNNRTLQIPIAVTHALSYSSLLTAYFLGGSPVLRVVYVTSSAVFFILYVIRHLQRLPRSMTDNIKVLVVFLIALHPALSFFYTERIQVWFEAGVILIPTIALGTFVYDRWILSIYKMKNKSFWFMIGQTVLLIIFLAFALVQRSQAIAAQEREMEMRRKLEGTNLELIECRTSLAGLNDQPNK